MRVKKLAGLLSGRQRGLKGFEEFYRLDGREDEALEGLTPRQVARLADSRLLDLGPQRIGDGVAIRLDGRLSAILKVGSVNLLMATRAEQESIIGAFHGLLRQLPDCQVQFKLRVEEARLSRSIERLDYSISHITSPLLGRMARLHRQHLRELERQGLLEFNQYVVVSLVNSRLVQMEQVYGRETGKQSLLSRKPGYPVRMAGQNLSRGVDAKSTHSPNKPGFSELFFSRKRRAASAASRKREQLLRARQISDMEQEFYEELQRAVRNLESCVAYIAAGLDQVGLSVHRLPDWELIALYAGYLRPELAGHTGIASRSEVSGGTAESFLKASMPVTPAEFAGELSQSLVTGEIPDSQAYLEGMHKVANTLDALSAASTRKNEIASVNGSMNGNGAGNDASRPEF